MFALYLKGNKMEFFETHAHYNDEKFENDKEETLEKIKEAGVTSVVVAGYDLESSIKAIEMSKTYENIYATCGISPNDINENWKEEIKQIKEIANEEKVVAVGEIGLDYYWNKDNNKLQKEVFKAQIEIANILNKPIVIHSRDAWQDTIEVLKEVPCKNCRSISLLPTKPRTCKKCIANGILHIICRTSNI